MSGIGAIGGGGAERFDLPFDADALAPEVPPGRTLGIGDRGDLVREAQERLIALGFLQDRADGVFGRKTERAVSLFQRANRLTPDGRIDGPTLRALDDYVQEAVTHDP